MSSPFARPGAVTLALALRGARASRAERVADRRGGRATDPWNLIWVMPAEGDLESNGPAVVFAGGDPVPEEVRHLLPRGALVVAADSGLDLARRLGVPVDLVVGDFDSADPAGVAAAAAAGSRPGAPPGRQGRHRPGTGPRRRAAPRPLPRADRGRGRLGPPRPPRGQRPPGRLPPLRPPAPALVGEGSRGGPGARPPRPGRAPRATSSPCWPSAARPPGSPPPGCAGPCSGRPSLPGSTRGVSNELAAATATVSVESGVLVAIHTRRKP